jgi:hypothetical protein
MEISMAAKPSTVHPIPLAPRIPLPNDPPIALHQPAAPPARPAGSPLLLPGALDAPHTIGLPGLKRLRCVIQYEWDDPVMVAMLAA